MNLNELFSNPDLLNILSLGTDVAQLTATLQSINEQVNTLDEPPIHPYDRIKRDLYGEDYVNQKFATIDDLPTPDNFVPHEMLLAVKAKTEEMHRTLSHNITAAPHLLTNTLLNTVSGDTIVPNIDKHKAHIEFVELIRQLPFDGSLTNEQHYDIAKKLTTQFLKTY